MFPQLGVGGTTPTPRNDSVASKTMALGTSRVAITITGASTFGRMSTNMIRNGLDPIARAASMYSFSLMDRVWPRTIRDRAAQEKKEITQITMSRVGPKTA